MIIFAEEVSGFYASAQKFPLLPSPHKNKEADKKC